MSFFGDIFGTTAARAQTTGAAQQVSSLEGARGVIHKATKKAVGYLQPYATSGTGANKLLADALGINGPEAQAAFYSSFQNDPGYMATRDAGIAGIDENRASAGALHSGGTLKALQDYGMRLMQSQFMDRLRGLGGLAGAGQTAATNQGQFQMGGANTTANILGNIGATRAAGTIGAANAKTAASTGLLNAGVQLAGAALGAGMGGGFGIPGGAGNYLSALTGGSGGWQTSIT